jgi:hypothetical protein
LLLTQIIRKGEPYFSLLVLEATGVAEATAAATPVLPLLLQRALSLPQAEEMEGLAAHLAEDKLEEKEREGGRHVGAVHRHWGVFSRFQMNKNGY